jgi:hypothetical protein
MTQPCIDSDEILALSLEGQPLRFSSSLMSFLSHRPGRQGFVLGDWLQALDGEMLEHLSMLSETALHNPQSMELALQDLLAVVVYAVAAERKAMGVELSTGQIHDGLVMLGIAAGLEGLRRKGVVEFETPLSIEPDATTAVRFTKEGLAGAGDIRCLFGAGLH